MIRLFALLALMPSLCVAQDWSVRTTISAPEVVRYTNSGDTNDLVTDDPEGEWLASEIMYFPEGADLPCAQQTALELDHYHGVDDKFSVNVFATLDRQSDGAWAVDAPAVFYDSFTRGEEVIASYEGYDDITVKIVSLQCAADLADIDVTYAGLINRYEGTGPGQIKIAGRATFTVPLTPYEEY